MIVLELDEAPVSWTPSRICRNISYNPKNREKKSAMHRLSQAYKGAILTDYVVLEFIFHFTPPQSVSKKRRAQMLAGEIIPTKSDCTNLQKFYEDCIKKIVIEDDRLVAKISSKKLYSEKEKVIIKIQTLKEHEDATCQREIQENN